MKVFLSWSGSVSHNVAIVLREWLPSVLQTIEPYVSSEDIDKGARWSTDITRELEKSAFGILCVTRENINAPWLNFEAGALSKAMDKSSVCPFLFDIKRSEVVGPILQFQSAIFDSDEIYKLVCSINNACCDNKLKEERLKRTFEVWYPSLEEKLKAIEAINVEEAAAAVVPDLKESIFEEVLELTRNNQKLLRNSQDFNDEIMGRVRSLTERLDFYYQDNNKPDVRNVNAYSLEAISRSMYIENNYARVRIMLCLLKAKLPWLYEIGIETCTLIQETKDNDLKYDLIRN
jgi:TIR domain-containing protein